jgi:hypothetical protein
MRDMQQKVNSMATAIGALNVDLNNSRQTSQSSSSRSQPKKSSSSLPIVAKKKSTFNKTSDDDDESIGSGTRTDVAPMRIMDNTTLKTNCLADGSAMRPVFTIDPRLTD